jgi:3-dehydroquinate dehydratase-2
MKKILVLHSVNLNMFGSATPPYRTIPHGSVTSPLARSWGWLERSDELRRRSEKIHKAHLEKVDAVVINGRLDALQHRLRDALAILKVPIIECHMSHPRAGGVPTRVACISPGERDRRGVRGPQLSFESAGCRNVDRGQGIAEVRVPPSAVSIQRCHTQGPTVCASKLTADR